MTSSGTGIPIFIAVAAAAISLAAAVASADPRHGTEIGRPGDPNEVSRTIEIVATDNAFDHKRIEVKEGETVRFVIRNGGELLHEFSIGTRAMQRAHQQEMMAMMQRDMFDGVSMAEPMTHDDPNSVMLQPGETKELTWTFSSDTALEFGCNVPGHYQAGMKGRIAIREVDGVS